MYNWPQFQQQHQVAEERVRALEDQARRQRYDPSAVPTRRRPRPLAVFLGLLVLLLLIFIAASVFTLTH